MIEFTVPGVPVGKGRPRTAVRGKFATLYTPKETVSYENLVKLKCEEAMQGTPPTDKACTVNIHATFPVAQSWSDKKKREAMAGRIHPTVKPDGDNILKIVCDAINGIAWLDDKQAVFSAVNKRYGEIPGVFVIVKELT